MRIRILWVAALLFSLLGSVSAADGDIALSVACQAGFVASEKNGKYLNDITEYRNFSSSLGSSIELQGSSLLTGSYYASLGLSTSMDAVGSSSAKAVNFGKLYFKSRLLDFVYLTVGKTSLNTFTRLDSVQAGVVAFDFLLLENANIVLASYVYDVANWDELSFALGVDYDYDFLNANAQVYLERLESLVGHAKASLHLAPFSLGLEGSLKQRSDNYFFTLDGMGNWESSRLERADSLWWSLGGSISLAMDPLSLSIEYSHNNEGYDSDEAEAFKDAVKAVPSEIEKYRSGLYDRNYLSFMLSLGSAANFGISLSSGISISLDRPGFLNTTNLNCRLNQNLIATLAHEWKYSESSSEYVLFSKDNQKLAITMSFAF